MTRRERINFHQTKDGTTYTARQASTEYAWYLKSEDYRATSA
jgi:predicted GIY-YIG superfamily endonuclease